MKDLARAFVRVGGFGLAGSPNAPTRNRQGARAHRVAMDASAPDGIRALHAFHARHKMALLARSPPLARRMGQLAAAGDLGSYRAAFLEASALAPDARGHANALEHLVGHVRDRAAARELTRLVGEMRAGRAQVADVKRALRHRLDAEGAQWASAQAYLVE